MIHSYSCPTFKNLEIWLHFVSIECNGARLIFLMALVPEKKIQSIFPQGYFKKALLTSHEPH